MSAFRDRIAGVLARLGEPVTFAYQVGEVIDPDTGQRTPGLDVESTVYGAPSAYRLSEIDGTVVRNGDIRLTVETTSTALDTSNIVANSDFEDGDTGWTLGAGWGIASEAYALSPASASSLSQALDTVAAQYYVAFDLIERYSGSVDVSLGGVDVFSSVSAVGSYSKYVNVAAAATLSVDASADFQGALDNFDVRRFDIPEPQVSWRCTLNGKQYRVMSVQNVRKSAESIVYILQLRLA